jgi:hypothetical protein
VRAWFIRYERTIARQFIKEDASHTNAIIARTHKLARFEAIKEHPTSQNRRRDPGKRSGFFFGLGYALASGALA